MGIRSFMLDVCRSGE